jgi:K+/H+ antiporter YhaU regulatory subunit KhtT
VVAVLRHDEVISSPTADFQFKAQDSLVVVATAAGIEQAAAILSSGERAT